MLGHILNRAIYPKPKPDYLTYSKLKTHEMHLEGLQGWRIPGSAEGAVGLYFGGNGEDVALSADSLAGFKAVYLFNYRGYGLSSGNPSQEALYSDSLRIYDHIARFEDASQLTVIGRSLGASVAVYISAQRPVKGVILITPFKSLVSLIGDKAGPLRWFLRDHFPSDQFARENKHPLLMLIAEHDTLIPNKQSLDLFQIWQGSKELKVIRNAGHNDLHNRSEYAEAMLQFLQASDDVAS